MLCAGPKVSYKSPLQFNKNLSLHPVPLPKEVPTIARPSQPYSQRKSGNVYEPVISFGKKIITIKIFFLRRPPTLFPIKLLILTIPLQLARNTIL